MRIRLIGIGWAFLSTICASMDAAELPALNEVDALVGREMVDQRIPGLSLGVIRSGKLVLAKGYGKASLELDVPATDQTLYGLGSISKQFTAAAVMRLVEDDKVGVDDRLTKFFDWVPGEWNAVTIRHLLTHTSGIREEVWKGGIVEFDFIEWI